MHSSVIFREVKKEDNVLLAVMIRLIIKEHDAPESGGKFYVSTPNILSMKSRFRFLFRGFPYAFKPLVMNQHDGMQHVASLSLNQYNYLALKHGFFKRYLKRQIRIGLTPEKAKRTPAQVAQKPKAVKTHEHVLQLLVNCPTDGPSMRL